MVDLDPDFMCLGRRDLNVLDAQLLAGFPRHGGLASDSLVMTVGQHMNLSVLFDFAIARTVSGSRFP